MFQDLIAEKNRLMFRLALVFFCKELGITKEEQGFITVQEVERLDKGTSGVCSADYNKKNELLKVEIKILSYASTVGIIDVLAHELVHARQHVRGEFYFQDIEHPIFFGLFHIKVREKFHKGQRLLTTSYYDRKCEQEAHSLSHELTTKFFAHMYADRMATESKDSLGEVDGLSGDDSGAETGEVEEGSVLGLS